MWNDFYEIATRDRNAPIAAGQGLYVLVEVQSASHGGGAERFQSIMTEAYEAGMIMDAAVAKSVQK